MHACPGNRPRPVKFELSTIAGGLIALISAAACAGCLVLWVVSFWTAGVLTWKAPSALFVAHSERNLIGLRFYDKYEGSLHGLRVERYPNPDYKQSSGLWDEIRDLHAYGLPGIGLGYRSNVYLSAPRRMVHTVYVPPWLAARPPESGATHRGFAINRVSSN
jgi:hypothetical protein